MAISDNYVPVKVSGNLVTTDFSASWNCIDSSYLVVQLQDKISGVITTQGLNSDFTVVFSDVALEVTFNSAPPSTSWVLISRSVAKDQQNPYSTSKGFQGQVQEKSFDKLTAITQEIELQTLQAVTTPSGTTPPVVTGAASTGCALIWNADGSIGTSVNQVDAVITTATALAAAAAVSAAASSVSQAASAASAASAALIVASWFGTSTTSITIGSGSKSWTTQSGLSFNNRVVLVVSQSTPTAYFSGMASYSGTTLTISSPARAGSGTHTDWVISVAGVQGATGATGAAGAPGSGSGDFNGPVSATDGAIIVFDGTSGQLGKDSTIVPGTLAGLSAVNNANWSGTALSIANGGTGQPTAAAAFAALVQTATTSTRGGVILASDSDAVTGTDTAKAVTPHALTAAITAALAAFTSTSPVKAWVTYDCNAQAILASYNVSSVTFNATGDITVNFTTAMSNANYGIAGTCAAVGGSHLIVEPIAWSTTSVEVGAKTTNAGGYQNSPRMTVIITD